MGGNKVSEFDEEMIANILSIVRPDLTLDICYLKRLALTVLLQAIRECESIVHVVLLENIDAAIQ